ncbi:hypothetical protein PRUPE_5G116900 [Prunus persica]|uniref:Uncharacterized protein n=1 Tax=Prunus persica TaxID=3760 RepID=A0A251P772_PRUPE|nr:hypothetical protein PRUPE_5G116900 [Prunus persica]
MTIACIQSLCKAPTFLLPSTFLGSSYFLQSPQANPFSRNRDSKYYIDRTIDNKKTRGGIVCGVLFPVDPWAPSIDSQSIASQLFAASLFPYLGFLYFITKSKSAPKLTLFGFYFLLAFVGATIPAGIYGKFSLFENVVHFISVHELMPYGTLVIWLNSKGEIWHFIGECRLVTW